jgi:hypothetical protein
MIEEHTFAPIGLSRGYKLGKPRWGGNECAKSDLRLSAEAEAQLPERAREGTAAVSCWRTLSRPVAAGCI